MTDMLTNGSSAPLKRIISGDQILPVKLGPPNKSRGPSLLTRIHAATSVDEVDKLMVEGESYRGASIQARRRWSRAAAVRKVAITNPPPAPKVAEKKLVKK